MSTTSDFGFAAVSAVGSVLSSLTVPYWVTGGWAMTSLSARDARPRRRRRQ